MQALHAQAAMEFNMKNKGELNPIDLKELFLNKFKEDDPELYLKILQFKEIFRIDDISSERYSILLLLDLFFAFENSSININAVVHEIKYLDGNEQETRTKTATQFRRPPLQGLWHKHYDDGNLPALAQNLKNALKDYSIPFFEDKIKEAEKSGEEKYVTAEDVHSIVNDAVSGNLQRRRDGNKITEEWIIYAIHEGKKYYLCLAKHGDGDEEIRKRINSSCIFEFPFLNTILPLVQ